MFRTTTAMNTTETSRPATPSRRAAPLNGWLALAFSALQGMALLIIPLLLLPVSPAWGWLLLLPVLLANSWWAFIHEALHGVMFRSKTGNRFAGRIHAILFGSPFDLLRWGHLLHHAHSRTPRERSEVYTPGRDRQVLFACGYYFRLLGGLYLMEVLGGLLFLLPRRLVEILATRLACPRNIVQELFERLLEARALTALRLDALAIGALHVGAFVLYGEQAWMLALALYGRALLISMMDNVFHYATPLDDTRYARDLALPAWASGLILHFNLHGLHHRKAGLAWHELAATHRRAGGRYQGDFFSAWLSQLRGPIPETRLAMAKQGAFAGA
jgi:fatty acid desaturase